jgi:4-amino-4-deoxy-L-arabinose transferase and related glycosyltransferases of PMT family
MLPPTDTPRDRQDTRNALLLGGGVLLVYLLCLCPTVYLGDSGEISTAIAVNGIIHPPGYPLFGLLGRMFLALVPVGEVAFRLGCLVATAAAGTVATLYLLLREAGVSRGPSLSAALVFAFGYTFWSQAVRVEVYSLHALFTALMLLGALTYRRTGRRRDLLVASLALACGIGHHLTIVLLVPTALLLCGPRLWRDPGLGARLPLLALPVLLGPAWYSLLALWASAEPLQNWSRPTTLPWLLAHATARVYRGLLVGPSVASVVATAKLILDAFPFGIVLLVAAGAIALWRRTRVLVAASLLGMALVFVYAASYRIDDIAPYLIPAWLLAALLLGTALDAAHAAARRHGQGLILASVLLVVLPMAQIVRNLPACNLRNYVYIREFARQKLEHCDTNAALMVQGDQDVFPVLYAQQVLGIRPDVLVIDRGMVNAMFNYFGKGDDSLWYLHDLKKRGAPLTIPEVKTEQDADRYAHDALLIDLLQELKRQGRPLFTRFTVAKEADVQRGLDRANVMRWMHETHYPLGQGLVVKLSPREAPDPLSVTLARNREIWANTDLPDLERIRLDQEMDGTALLDQYASMLMNYGDLYVLAGDPAAAAQVYTVVEEWLVGTSFAERAREKKAALGAKKHERAEKKSGTIQ